MQHIESEKVSVAESMRGLSGQRDFDEKISDELVPNANVLHDENKRTDS